MTEHAAIRASSRTLPGDFEASRHSPPILPRPCLEEDGNIDTNRVVEDRGGGAQSSVRAFIALGSNLGDRRAYLDKAIEYLASTPSVVVTAISPIHEYAAVGGPADSPPFLNAVAEIETSLMPRQLLDRLLKIERDLGRERREKWGPRNIDLDLILYGQEVIRENGLTVPHPMMQQRRFVLQPLAEIAADHQHPVLRKTISELVQQLEDKE